MRAPLGRVRLNRGSGVFPFQSRAYALLGEAGEAGEAVFGLRMTRARVICARSGKVTSLDFMGNPETPSLLSPASLKGVQSIENKGVRFVAIVYRSLPKPVHTLPTFPSQNRGRTKSCGHIEKGNNMTISRTDRFSAMLQAGMVQRWHTNPWLAASGDRADGHAARVARIILFLHPAPSADLIGAALTHDDGEIAVGDMKATLKDARPDIADALAQIEDAHARMIWGQWPPRPGDLSPKDRDWLHFADRLDAWLWAQRCGCDTSRDGWPEAAEWLTAAARRLVGPDAAVFDPIAVTDRAFRSFRFD